MGCQTHRRRGRGVQREPGDIVAVENRSKICVAGCALVGVCYLWRGVLSFPCSLL